MTTPRSTTIEKRFEEFCLSGWGIPERATGWSALALARGLFQRAVNKDLVQVVDGIERVLAVPGMAADRAWLDLRRHHNVPGAAIDITKIYTEPELSALYPGNMWLGSRTVVASGRTAYPIQVAGVTAVFGFAESMKARLGDAEPDYSLEDQLSAWSFKDNFGVEVNQETPDHIEITDLKKLQRLRRGLSLMTQPIASYVRLDLMFAEPVDPATVEPDPAQLLHERPGQAVIPIFAS